MPNTVASDVGMQANERGDPEPGGLGRAQLPAPGQERADQAGHGFDRSGGPGQAPVGILAVCAIVREPTETFSDGHPQPRRGERLGDETTQPCELALERVALALRDRRAGQLVERFPTPPIGEVPLAPAPPQLEPTHQMEVTQLQHPAPLSGEGDKAPQIIGNEGTNPSVEGDGNVRQHLDPVRQILAARQQDRIKEDRRVRFPSPD